MLDSLDLALREQFISDGGPFYNEFHHECLVKEPWNAYSSLVFFVPIIFWLFKLRGEYKKHWIILMLLPFLFLNGLGSTLYHAFRNDAFFLLLDFMPANVMSVILASYFWFKVMGKWSKSILIVLSFYAGGWLLLQLSYMLSPTHEYGPNIGYLIVGLSYFIPIILILMKTNGYKIHLVIYSVVFLTLALVCRVLDYPTPNYFVQVLPQGTHFLWHIFSVGAVFSMGYYVYYLNKLNNKDV